MRTAPLSAALRWTLALALLAAVAASAQITPVGSQYWFQDTTGIQGAAEAGDEFGRSLAAGDFNCDGYDDLAIGVPYEDVTFDCDGNGSASTNECTDAGAVAVIYGSPLGLHASLGDPDQLFAQDTTGVPSHPEVGDRFGWALAAIDRGGCHDLAVGAPYEDVNGTLTHVDAGAVFYFRGTTGGLVPDGIIVQGQDGVPESSETGDQFGYAVAQAPASWPGFVALAIGAPGEDRGLVSGTNEGAVVIVGQSLDSNSNGDLPSPFQCETLNVLGTSVSTCYVLYPGQDASAGRSGEALAVGLLGTPGYPQGWLAVGRPRDDAGTTVDVGRASIFGHDGDGEITFEDGGCFQGPGGSEGAEGDDRFGSSFAVGDFNGDGDFDLAIGVPYEDALNDAVINAGAVATCYGNSHPWGFPIPVADGSPSGQFFIQDETGFETTQADDHFGEALAAGDFNGDGRDDLAIGVPDENRAGLLNTGYLHVLYGSASGLTTTGDQAFDLDDPDLIGNVQASDYFGEAVAAGDFDGDGRDDLAISAPGITGGVSPGGVYVLFGGLPGGFLDEVSVENTFSSISESQSSHTIRLVRTGNLTQPLTVNYGRHQNSTATVGADHVQFSGGLAWAAGEGGEKSFVITLLGDTIDEPNETIEIFFNASSHCREPGNFVVTLVDDDAGGDISFLNRKPTYSEPIGGNASISVRRLNGAASNVTVQYATSNLTAIAGVDYTAVSGTLTFPAGDSLETFAVPVVNDGVAEGCEYVKLTLSSPGGGGALADPSVAQLALYDSPNLLFCDGFELGSAVMWSGSAP
jgi:hypothetical protein